MSNVTLAMGKQFLTSYSALPKGIQSKVRQFMGQFKNDPKASAIHYEPVHEFIDNKLRSVRIDQNYRGIVLDTGSDNTFILLWVDNHDEAYRWAKNKTFGINPETGAIQFLESETIVEAVVPEKSGAKDSFLFDRIRDRELVRLGVPEILIPYIRLIQDTADLEQKVDSLSPEVSEILQFLAIGTSVEDLERELSERTPSEEPIDTEDFKAALERSTNGRSYAIITDDKELQDILDFPLDKWRIFLHPGQRSLVEKSFTGPARVLGGAGTGKTVVAMHRARHLAQKIIENKSTKQVLFTTFSKNLAANISQNLQKICSVDELRRIEVKNLDAWALEFLRSRSLAMKIVQDKTSNQIWDDIANRNTWTRPLSFYRWEWEKVVQQNGISTLPEYLKVRRIGSGTGLNRKERMKIWEVFQEYRSELENRDLIEYDDAIRSARQVLEQESSNTNFAHVVVDEAQDFSQNAFALIAKIATQNSELGPGSLFIVGDSQQRIYGRKVTLKHCGIHIQGRSRILKINYRTTDEIGRFATSTLSGKPFDDLDGGTLTKSPYLSLVHGEDPVMLGTQSFAEELQSIKGHIESIIEGAGAKPSICVVVRTNSLLQQYKIGLEAIGVLATEIQLDSDSPDEGILISTMHRVKGLEFDHLVLAAASNSNIPNQWMLTTAPTEIETESLEIGERSLVYVALTRARKSVAVSWFGERSTLLPKP